jgi:large subunit ribosomal protein L24
MKKYKIKKNDTVVVLAGKEKGKTGVVREILTKNDRAIVGGLNMAVCFNKRERTGMSQKESSIHISNLSHADPVDGKATRVKMVIENGVKSMVSKRSNKIIREVTKFPK